MGRADAFRYLNEVAIPLIREQGWTVQGHMESATELGGNITYTVGLTDAGLPELAVSGLPHQVAAVLLNDCARTHLNSEFAAGMTVHAPAGATLRVVDAPGVIGPVARALYGQRARFLQLLWPDPDGNYPDEAAWTDADHPRQPVYARPLPADRMPTGDGVLGHYDDSSHRASQRRITGGDE